MGKWETFFLIRALQFLFRWLSSNEKNRKVIEDKITDKVVDAIHEALKDNNE